MRDEYIVRAITKYRDLYLSYREKMKDGVPLAEVTSSFSERSALLSIDNWIADALKNHRDAIFDFANGEHRQSMYSKKERGAINGTYLLKKGCSPPWE